MIVALAIVLIVGGFRLGMYLGERQFVAGVEAAASSRYTAIVRELR